MRKVASSTSSERHCRSNGLRRSSALANVVFLAKFAEKRVRNDVGSRRFKLRVQQFVGFGIDCSVQPVALIAELNHGFVDRDVIRAQGVFGRKSAL